MRTTLRLTRWLPLIGALALATPAIGAAQTPSFRSGVDMVPLTVTVTDGSGNYVSGLTADDFIVLEDGVKQSVSFFARERMPLDVALVLDTSGSMGAAMPLVRAAAGGLVRSLRDGDRAAVMSVSTSVGMPTRFTTDLALATSAINKLSASGSTAVYDGVYIALQELARGRRQQPGARRQVLVLLSDGLDNMSHVSADDVANQAKRADVSIYVVALGRPSEAPPAFATPHSTEIARAMFELRALAQTTGGRIFLPALASELPAVYGEIARELANQYDLGYTPVKPGDGAFRRIAVRVQPPASGVARTRAGYHASRAPTQPVVANLQTPNE